ncbi:hypothetical protein [Enterococcus hermanniensis]|uniref:Cation transporter n=1 Tax=Enterococcus hermanniensis TaxID=249189 RepID=A0A1L8TQV1_9ENTE|nr:hypothetical protein [Enterococcus hermanniensis]OJG46667.1 hypothetical protein RV04_GL001095 [Enterococcus hermanniensis]
MLNLRDQAIRLRWSSFASFGIAVGKLIVAIMTFSIFLGINAFYTATIGYGKHQSAVGLSRRDEISEESYYRRIGLLILVASIIYLIYGMRMFFTNTVTDYEKIPAISIAAITFFELGLNLFGIVKSNKDKDLLLQAAKLLNLSSALIGLVLTQAALLSFTETKTHPIANLITTILFSGINIVIGIWMLAKKMPENLNQ